MTDKKCETCGDPPHKPGQCERCGCGESEVIYPKEYKKREYEDEDFAEGYRIFKW